MKTLPISIMLSLNYPRLVEKKVTDKIYICTLVQNNAPKFYDVCASVYIIYLDTYRSFD